MRRNRKIALALVIATLILLNVLFSLHQLKTLDAHLGAVGDFLSQRGVSLRARPDRSVGDGISSSRKLSKKEAIVVQAALQTQAAPARLAVPAPPTVSTASPTVLTTTTFFEALEYDMVWQGEQGGPSFARLAITASGGTRRWVELRGNDRVFSFTEQNLSGMPVDPKVIVFDSSRGLSVRLADGQAHYRTNAVNDGERWVQLLGEGAWAVIDGVRLRIHKHPAYTKASPPPPQHAETENGNVKIMILISAYRDVACGNTLYEAFLNAEHPDRIIIGVVDQNEITQPSCLETYCGMIKAPATCRRDQVRSIRVPLDKSRGVMPARYQQQLLVRDEEFCLQIDAHCLFEYNWDTMALNDWLLAENEMAVITTYPHGVGMIHLKGTTPARCETAWNNGIVVDGVVADVRRNPTKRPFLQPFFGAGLAFSKCHAVYNVPYDPYMPFLFKGEEFNQAIRLFTHGYDVYAPLVNYVYHFYDSEKETAKRFGHRTREFVSMSDGLKHDLVSQAEMRWRRVLGLKHKRRGGRDFVFDDDLSTFGLGTRRSLKQFEEFANVDFSHETQKSQCNMLGKLQWVPYEYEDEVPGNRFRPSGPSCPAGQTHRCCTNLARSISTAMPMLNLTNSDLWDMLKKRSHLHRSDVSDELNKAVYAPADASFKACKDAF